MIRVYADKIASVTKNLKLGRELRVDRERILAEEGYLIAGRILNNKTVYNTLEDPRGRMVRIHEGDVIVGALGSRNALHGYSGIVPQSIKAGDTLQILNLGGVIGECTSINPEVGKPFDIEVLGSVLIFPEFESREGVLANIAMGSIERLSTLQGLPRVPVVYVAGTCMNSGKTMASCHLVRHLSNLGLKVGACKLTGVALMRDVLEMTDYGADWGVSFIDAGIPSTTPRTALLAARTLLGELVRKGSQVIVAELGDGILGEYGVRDILADRELMSYLQCLVFCASDPVGVWGGLKILEETFGLKPDVITGPATDNAVGTSYIENKLGVPAINARTNSKALGELVYNRLGLPEVSK